MSLDNIDSIISHAPHSTAPHVKNPLQGINGENWRDRLWDYVSTNSLFSAGAGLMAITVAGAYARRALILSRSLLVRRFVSTLEVDNNDPSYRWLLDYINK